jgi:hypothetical protein
MRFIQPQAKFMDQSLASDYKQNFTGEEAMQYEMIARLSIAYLDDLYHIRSGKVIRKWFRGSLRLLAGTHRKWLADHEDSYDPKFYKFILKELDHCPHAPRTGSKRLSRSVAGS